MKTKTICIAFLSCLLAAGCTAPTTNIDIANDKGKPVLALDYRDFDAAAGQMIQSMLASGAVTKPGGGRYVVTTSRIINDTMQRVDTDQLMAKIEEELLNSGQVVMTSAVGGKGAPDPMTLNVRDLRDSEEFNPDTVPAEKTLIAPELSISGKIFQRNLSYDKKQQQVEYYFQLQTTDLKSGLRLWQKEVLIGKRGSNKSVAW